MNRKKTFFLLAFFVVVCPMSVFSKGKKQETLTDITLIEPDIKDKKVKRQLDKLTRPKKREFFFDSGVNMLFYQEMSFLFQEWKWFESTDSTPNYMREDVLDTRLMVTMRARGGEYTINTGYNFSNIFGFGINVSMPFFPFLERDQYSMLPVFRIDAFPYFLIGVDIAKFLNVSIGIGPHLGYYHYKQILDNPNKFNPGLMTLETKLLAFGFEAMPQIRFNIGDVFYLGMRAQIIYDPFSLQPEINRFGFLPAPSGTETSYNYYFFGSLMIKSGIFMGIALRNFQVYKPKNQNRQNFRPPAESPAGGSMEDIYAQ